MAFQSPSWRLARPGFAMRPIRFYHGDPLTPDTASHENLPYLAPSSTLRSTRRPRIQSSRARRYALITFRLSSYPFCALSGGIEVRF